MAAKKNRVINGVALGLVIISTACIWIWGLLAIQIIATAFLVLAAISITLYGV